MEEKGGEGSGPPHLSECGYAPGYTVLSANVIIMLSVRPSAALYIVARRSVYRG